jgi:hypothetical protein
MTSSNASKFYMLTIVSGFTHFFCSNFVSVFLDCLEPFLLDHVVQSVSNDMLLAFINHMNAKGLSSTTIERCLLQLDLSATDLRYCIPLCRSHRLHSSFIHLISEGLLDFFGPVAQMCELIRNLPHESAERKTVGYKLLVYLKCCFSGRKFSDGSIRHHSFTARVQSQILAGLFHQVEGKMVHFAGLPVLIQFDAEQFFRVLMMAFDNPAWLDVNRLGGMDESSTTEDFTATMSATSKSNDSSKSGTRSKDNKTLMLAASAAVALPSRLPRLPPTHKSLTGQHVMDVLIEIFFKGDGLKPFKDEFFRFAAEIGPRENLRFSPDIVESLIHFLLVSSVDIRASHAVHLEPKLRENLLLKIVQKYPLSRHQQERIAEEADSSGLFKVSAAQFKLYSFSSGL